MYSIQTQILNLVVRRDILMARGPYNIRIIAKIDRRLRKLRATQE